MKICVFGDSVTYAGYNENSWANLLRRDLEKNYDEDVEFFNLGINENTSEDILKRFDIEAQARNPEIIVFAFGVNDSGYIFDTNEPLVEIGKFEENVRELINKTKNYTTDIIFVGLVLGDDSILKPYPESSKGKSYDHKKVEQYDDLVMKLAKENGCDYIYLYDQLDNSDFIDGLHPNESGHKKMYDTIKRIF